VGLQDDLLRLWNPPWGYFRLNARGKFIRTLWTGPVVISVIFCAFYFPLHHAGLSIKLPLAAAGVLAFFWIRQLLDTATQWRDEVAARQESDSDQ
jgi:hypothetical protein